MGHGGGVRLGSPQRPPSASFHTARPRASRRRLGWWRTTSTGVLIAAAAILLVGLLAAGLESGRLGYDFRGAYLPAAQSVRHGISPYPDPDSLSGTGLGYIYPPQLAVALVPLTAAPVGVAAAFAFIGSLAALIGALALIGVRDLRCYAAFLLWAPAWSGLEALDISALPPGASSCVAISRPIWPLATVLGIAVSAKLFLLPLVVWAAATRGLRTAGWLSCSGSRRPLPHRECDRVCGLRRVSRTAGEGSIAGELLNDGNGRTAWLRAV